MNVNDLADYTGLDVQTIQKMLQSTPHAIYTSQEYIEVLRNVDSDLLEETLPEARRIYSLHLDEFAATLENRYDIHSNPMSAFTLGNWVVGVMQYPQRADALIEMHHNLPTEVFSDNLSDLIDMLGEMNIGREVWQQAMCLLAFPMMAG